MSYDYFTPLFVNTIIFYLIGIIIIFLISYLKVFTTNNTNHSDFIFTKKIKLLILLFSIIFSSIFVGLYYSPYAFVISWPSISANLVITLSLTSIISIILIFYCKENLENITLTDDILLVFLSLVFSIIVARISVFETYISGFNQNKLIIEALFVFVFGLIFYVLIIKGIKLLVNNHRTFDSKAHKFKYSLFFLMIFLIFTLFSYQTQITVQSNDYNYNAGAWNQATFSHDLSEIAFFGVQNSTNFLGVNNLTANSVTYYSMCNLTVIQYSSCSYPWFQSIKSMAFYNNTILEFFSYESEINTYLYTLNLKTKAFEKINLLSNYIYGYSSSQYNYYVMNIPSYSMHIKNITYLDNNDHLTNNYPYIDNISFINTTTGSINNFEIYSNSTFDQYSLTPDLSKLAVTDVNSNQIQIYSLNKDNNSISLPQNTLDINTLNMHFIPSDNPQVVYFGGISGVYSYNYTNSKLTMIANGKAFYTPIVYVNSKHSYILNDWGNVYHYSLKNKTATLIKYLNWNEGEKQLFLMNYNPITNSTTKQTGLYSKWLPQIQFDLLNMIEDVNFIFVVIFLVVTIYYTKKEKVLF